MAVVGPQNVGLPGYRPGDQQKPKPVVGPQNVGLPGYRPGDVGNPYPAPAPVAAPAAPAPAAVAPPPPAPAPPPIDFNAQTLIDPEYQQGHAHLVAQNTMNLKTLGDAFRRNSQSSYDNANAHGALFSGAAANAQGSIKDAYDNPVNGQLAQQALDFDRGGSGLYFSVFNRLKQQLAPAGTVT